MVHQLTIFLENRPGRINSISAALLENALNIWAFIIQDRGEFGLVKLIVDKPAEAKLILADRGFACTLKEVLAVRAPNDQPGNLDRLTKALLEKNVNIKDAYGFVSLKDQEGYCFMEFENPDSVDLQKTISEHGFTILEDAQLYDF